MASSVRDVMRRFLGLPELEARVKALEARPVAYEPTVAQANARKRRLSVPQFLADLERKSAEDARVPSSRD